MLFESGDSDDIRYFEMALGIEFSTRPGLADLGVDEPLDMGQVMPSDARLESAQRRART
jgi:hypothetical protein